MTSVRWFASRYGLSEAQYLSYRAAGLSRCRSCLQWKPCTEFHRNKNLHDGYAADCKECCKQHHRLRYHPVAEPKKGGAPRIAARDGDKRQARRRIQYLIKHGYLPHPNTIACVLCGHLGADHRHEYDHYSGYSSAYHETVRVLCKPCHFAEERKIGTYDHIDRRHNNGRIK